MDNADAPIRCRVARELLHEAKATEKFESELLENHEVQFWLGNLKPKTPPQHWSMEHGSFDFCLENAISKIVQLGLHGGMPQVKDALGYYEGKMKSIESSGLYGGMMKNNGISRRKGKPFFAILTANFLSLAETGDEPTLSYTLDSLDEIYRFAKERVYEIYLNEEQRKKTEKRSQKPEEHKVFYQTRSGTEIRLFLSFYLRYPGPSQAL